MKGIITGGAQGIGKGAALRIVQSGGSAAIWDCDDEAGNETADELSRCGDIFYVHCDVSKEEDVALACRQTLDRFGEIDFLINNAGIMIRTPVMDLSLEEWNRVIGTNLTGTFLCSRACASHLRKTEGSIINICSTRAFMSEPDTESY
ncbi:MAG: SDR family NAD(P)-dependent oxidoreductase, partial [Spirochaetota bacterium]